MTSALPTHTPPLLGCVNYVPAVLQVRDGLRAAVEGCGVVIRTEAEVLSIDCESGCVTGVSLASGETLGADVVVANRDVPGAYQLLSSDYGQKQHERLSGKRFSAGVISFNWVVRDAGFPSLLHHNVFISGDLPRPFPSTH